MRILHARFLLPARMKTMAPLEARQLAEAVAQELYRHGQAPARLSIQLDGLGRPTRQLAKDLGRQTARAVAAERREA